MSNKIDPRKRAEQIRFTVLSQMDQVGKPVNFLEMGFTASPQVIRNMAAWGLIRVTVDMTDRGRDYLAKEQAKRKLQKFHEKKEKRVAGNVFG